ncbi:thymus-specific serine protease [Colossoma macropomum]|uniref:thymus-specific serine protease n=1 Tax=Colossoma macropomum TaxID=42526 RepID=UPI0018646EE2|nr:thymus-specific serine protease [Colossoma macropomum]
MTLSRWLMMILFIDFASSGRVLWKIKARVREAQEQRAQGQAAMLGVSAVQLLEGLIQQPLQHFNRKNAKTFPQRFFVNEAHWNRPHGPVFLYIGGEGLLSKFSVLAGHHVSMAGQHGALLVALEHRFYGQSIIPGGLETQDLEHLSSQEALADLAAFHQHISQKYNLTCRNVWISFGGSYAGALSAWFRGKFPHLVYGAVASSAPVQAKLDFSAYNLVVGHSLRDESVGGSEKCVKAVRESFALLEAALLGGNETQVGKDFRCCETPKSPEDQAELLQSVADIFMGTVQYNEEVGPLTITRICDIMTEDQAEGEEAYHRLVKLSENYRSMEKKSCLEVSWAKTIQYFNQTTDESFGYRQWFYQTCTEFGFYQTCEDSSCLFSHMRTLQTQTQLCLLLFNISQHTLPANIDFTNQYYGGDQPQTHRVLYVNGDIDPWMTLSIVRNGTGEDKHRAVLIRGSAHCADMNPLRSSDRTSLKQARKEIEGCVSAWLKSAAQEYRD